MFLISQDGKSATKINSVDARFDFTDGECVIVANKEFAFGRYDDSKGKMVFEEIINSIKNESAYFDMREVAFDD